MEVRPIKFDTNEKKVKYIADHLITLQNILSTDEALSTMLVDMINRAIYGADTPSIVPPDKYSTEGSSETISLPPRPDELQEP
tara:strand:+ start:1180 stop:1428 length:249 start_codon:yes stop_codon:yes gene_type:complete